jgi:hypothetical protein
MIPASAMRYGKKVGSRVGKVSGLKTVVGKKAKLPTTSKKRGMS